MPCVALIAVDRLELARRILPVALLAVFWCWESWRPFFEQRNRLRHGGINLLIAATNTLVIGLVFGSPTVAVVEWAGREDFGLLRNLPLADWARGVLVFVLLDAWLYLWHRANHRLPWLWRFHRMHHTDRAMDVTTATRFHLGEQVASATLRLGLLPLLGVELVPLLIYDACVVANTQFHHANISLGRWDRPLRWLVVTPDMHKIHHSDQQPETDSNYSTVFSVWDRLAQTFRMREQPSNITFGLPEYTDSSWHTWRGLWKTPFVDPPRADIDG
jgi:sterol desaturase/sphingolipid hydroxylase (fatty acid hydroxylase superfamily)